MRVTSPAVTIKDIWDALVVSYGVAGSYGLLIETNLDAPVSGAKADLTTLETRLSAARATALDELLAANLPADIAAIPIAPALAASWTAALAIALGAYTAAKAAFLDVAISSRLATAAYTAERGTDSAALASAWTAALATALASYTAVRAAKLDNLDARLTYTSDSPLIASDDLIIASDEETAIVSNSTMTKEKEIRVRSGTLRTKFDLRNPAGDHATGQIYKNDAGFGTSRSVSVTSYQTFSEDLVYADGDLHQLFCRSWNAGTGQYQARYFRVYGKFRTFEVLMA